MSRISVKRPFTVFVAVIIILVLGFEAFTKLSTDLLPNMNLPYAIVITTYPGANPETVEMVVTDPVESSMATISNIKNITSVSSENVSMVVLEFEQSANMDSVTIDMREKLDLIESYWPDTIGNPMIMKLNPDMMPIMMLAVDQDGKGLEEVSDFVNDTLSGELKSINGVASVTASGLLETSLQVVLSEKNIQKLNEELMEKLENKFADAKSELDDGKKQLEDGKSQLDSQSAALTQQMLDATAQITDGKIEIAQNQEKLENALAQVEAAEAELDSKEAELLAAKEALEKNEDIMLSLEELIAMFEEQIASSESDLAEINDKIASLQQDAAANAQEIEVLTVHANALQELIDSSKRGLELLSDQGIAVGATESAKAQIEQGLAIIAQTRIQLATSRTEIQSGMAQIATAKTALEQQQSALNAAQAQAENQLDDARIQLITGEQQLENAQQQLEESIKNAKSAADLEGVINAEMVSTILTAQNFAMPAGYVSEDGTDYLIRVGEEISDQEELENLVLFDLSDYDLGKVRLKDVAMVIKIDNSGETYAKINGNDGIILSLEKQDGYSTADVAKSIREYMKKASEKYEGLHMTALMDQGIYIDYVVSSVLKNLVIGALLAILVLFIFLKDIRPTFIVALSIPISVVFAIVLMYFSGITMNIISLSGLALGVGMLVDNAIVTIENIYRLRSLGKSPKEAAIEGAGQIAGAIIASTLTTVCIWAPIVFAEGITRMIFVDLVLTIAYSLLASLVVALTVVPAASATILKKTRKPKDFIFKGITNVYGFLLHIALKIKPLVLALALALFIGSAYLLVGQGYEFMGEMDSDQMTISVTMPEDAVFDDTAAMSDEIIERISAIEGVDTVGSIMGSSLSLMGSYSGTNVRSLSMYVILDSDREEDSQTIARKISESTKDLACEITVSSSSMDMSSLGGSGVSVEIKGKDLQTLQKLANDFADILAGIDGTVDVSNGIDDPTKELQIVVNKNKAMTKGLTVAQVFAELNAYVSEASTATTLSVGTKDYPVMVISSEEKDLTPEDIRNYVFKVKGQDGTEEEVPLKKIATINEGIGLSKISRANQQRYLTVSSEIDDDHNVTLVSEEFEKRLKAYDMPDGFTYEMSGENETIMDSMMQLLKLLGVGTLIMYLIMVAQFQSFISPFIVLFTLPLAFTGGFIALLITDNIISIISMVGFVLLSGIIVNNGIVFIDYVNQLREQGMNKHDALIETGKTRLRPILMTALTTIFAMSTMALGIGTGTDMVQPMAIVTIGGLIYGTLMTLFVVPCIYDLVRREKKGLVSSYE